MPKALINDHFTGLKEKTLHETGKETYLTSRLLASRFRVRVNKQQMIKIIDITILKDGWSAKDIHGNIYIIESIMLGIIPQRKEVKYSKQFLSEKATCRVEILQNNKLKII